MASPIAGARSPPVSSRPMGVSPPALTIAHGPAKWAAVVVLSAACGAGLTWSAVRARAPRGTVTPAIRVDQQPLPAPAAAPRPAPERPAATDTSLSTEKPAPAPSTASTDQSQAPAPTLPAAPDPAPAPPAPAAPLAGAPSKAPGLTHRININKAQQAELELLPGVGPAMAKQIMDYRALHGPFKTIADLDKVKGIGPKKLAKIAPLVTVE